MPSALKNISTGRSRPEDDPNRYLLFPPAGASVGILAAVAEAGRGRQVLGCQYPGRSDRLADALPERLEDLADQTAREASDVLGRDGLGDTTLVGFSMGALVAFEVARRVVELGGRPPSALIVVGATAPHRRGPRHRRMPTEQELTAVLALHGMDVLSEESADAEARVYAMDLLRSDMRLTTAYAGPRATAPCPVGALCGKDDPLCPTRDGTFEWESWSGGNFAAREVEGKHLDLLSPHRAKEFWEIMAWLGMRGVGCDVGRPAGDRKT